MYILICFGLTKRTVLLLLFVMVENLKNALDTNNEKEIMEHLHRFYRGRTVVVVAHRLSTVRDADNIVVLDKGRVAEEGTHEELTAKRGIYYKLVMEKGKDIELRSEAVQEVMGHNLDMLCNIRLFI